MQSIRLSWGDGSMESIDLAYVRSARDVFVAAEPLPPGSPEVLRVMKQVREGSNAMAELALLQLGLIRQRTPPERAGEWALGVDPVVIESARRGEDRIEAAAWKYFAMQSALTNQTLSLFESTPANSQRMWVGLIGRHAGSRESPNSEVARSILFGLLRSGTLDTCENALGVMASLNMEIDWSRVSSASKNAQMAALNRLTLLRRDEAISALLTIMKSVRRSSAEEVAKYVRTLNLRLEDPRDPLLQKWPQLKSDSDRISLLTVLHPANLGDLIYSQPISAILQTGLSPKKSDSRLQREVLDMLIAQLNLRENSAEPNDGGFPVLLRMRTTDPIARGVIACAHQGTIAQRKSAVRQLMKMGLSVNALDAMDELADDGEIPEAILKELLDPIQLKASDGLIALCGRLLRPDHAEFAELVLANLNKWAAGTPSSEHWRIRAALRAGADVESLSELAAGLRSALSVSAIRWLHQLCHFSLQDGQVYAAANSAVERRHVLEELDLRRAQLVDGDYGVVAVVEFCDAQSYSLQNAPEVLTQPLKRWGAPRRQTIVASNLRLAPSSSMNRYQVFWNEAAIGSGRSRQKRRPLRSPESFLPALVDAPSACLSSSGWGWPAPTSIAGFSDESAIGPSILPGNRPALDDPGEDLMTLEVSAYLGAAMLEARLLNADQLRDFSDVSVKMTLRYAGFGSYVGVAPTREFTTSPESDRRHVLNVMLFLEKLSD
ncbi:MAG: hypothetical protein IPK83_01215 [Planctomycetes bacterium]|nr:hypothetical protein [Planctomycetota bacterium]